MNESQSAAAARRLVDWSRAAPLNYGLIKCCRACLTEGWLCARPPVSVIYSPEMHFHLHEARSLRSQTKPLQLAAYLELYQQLCRAQDAHKRARTVRTSPLSLLLHRRTQIDGKLTGNQTPLFVKFHFSSHELIKEAAIDSEPLKERAI